jgi:hypothetical protein
MPISIKARSVFFLKELLKYNKNEILKTNISRVDLQGNLMFVLDYSSQTTINTYINFLKFQKILIENQNCDYIFDKERARKFIEENDWENLKRKIRDNKIKSGK